jgi:hypothetical protein
METHSIEKPVQNGGAVVRGIAASNGLLVAALAIIRFVLAPALGSSDFAALFAISSFILIPFAMGIVGAFPFVRGGMRGWELNLGMPALNTVVALVVASVFFGEGAGCLLIVSPITFLSIFLGNGTGAAMARRRPSARLQMSIAGLVLLFGVSDVLLDKKYDAVVTDVVEIDAPVEKVWPYVVEFPPIEREPEYWFFRVGLPMPMSTVVDAHREGARRRCIFSNGATFDETMTEFRPHQQLTFDIVAQPADPEIIGHIALKRGQFRLEPLPGGRTRLVGTSWYTLTIAPAWYFDLWAESITRNVHVRVMNHIADLAEGRRPVAAIAANDEQRPTCR